MLMPEDGHFTCGDECGFVTCDIFEFIEHCGIEFSWNVKLSKRYSFDLYMFLERLNSLTMMGDLEMIEDHIQNATLLMVNATENELEPFIEEMVVESEIDDMFKDVEQLLKENRD